eukprot:TRINITY_DN255_c0_g2_i5.p1 TRINITY_DN255_c0_g2~~TRINITY_DN255_c0_g2_i5.p1  ORF type:complete len:192 (-),score=94.18 TRINITY_DN255_c0_g2_i5:196-771(-)
MSIYKLVILGDGGVGKSALTIQFTQNHFVREYDPTIENSYRKQITVDDDACMLDILDTAGQEEYSVMRDQYINTGQGFMLVFSVTTRNSFKNLAELRDRILQMKDTESFPIVLIGNKCDLDKDRQVPTNEGKELATSWHVPFLEASAKSRINVEEGFREAVRELRRHHNSESGEQPIADRVEKKKSSCNLL